jgi:uncharacterized protein with HEPN domain
MQQAKENDLLPILVILESCGKILKYISEFEEPLKFFEFDDQSRFNATLMLLTNIGENVNRISSNTKAEFVEIDWLPIKSLRNRIAHDYTGIDFEKVFEIGKKDLPSLIKSFESIIILNVKKNIFDLDELLAAKGSMFYTHVNFSIIEIVK